MTKTAGIGFNPGVGIERVIAPHDGPGISVLPSSTRIVPSETTAGMPTVQSRYLPAWDREMFDFLQHRIHTRELLIPGVFAARIRQARNQLDKRAQQTDSATLRNAVDVLDDDSELRQLLDTYRHLLIPG